MEVQSTKPKRVRASKPKVRSGCITCKVRRVKCDETRPGCLRCQKFGRDCDGYLSDQTPRRGLLVPLQPRPTTPSPAPSLHNTPPHDDQFSLFTNLVPSPTLYGDNDDGLERCYFQLYCDRTATELAGFFQADDFWLHAATEESLHSSAVYHAVVALGAFTASLCAPSDPILTPFFGLAAAATTTTTTTDHHRHAFTHYQLAVQHEQQQEQQDHLAQNLILLPHLPPDPPHLPSLCTALTALLLLLSFANFHHDYVAATTHLQRAIRLLDEYRAHPHHGPHSLAALHASSAVKTLARCNAESHVYATQFLGHNGGSGSGSGSISATDPPNNAPRLLSLESTGIIMPTPIPLLFPTSMDALALSIPLAEACSSYHHTSAPHLPSLTPPLWLLDSADACATQLQLFEDALWPLLVQQQSSHQTQYQQDGPPNYGSQPVPPKAVDPHHPDPAATVLYLANKIAAMRLQTSVVSGEMPWDGFGAHFAEILARCRRVMRTESLERDSSFPSTNYPKSLDYSNSPGSSSLVSPATSASSTTRPPTLSSHPSLIPPLHLVASKCRDPVLRREAISLLLSKPRREGMWDSVLVGSVDAWVMGLEEEGLGCGAEEARWSVRGVELGGTGVGVGTQREGGRERWASVRAGNGIELRTDLDLELDLDLGVSLWMGDEEEEDEEEEERRGWWEGKGGRKKLLREEVGGRERVVRLVW